MVGVLPALGAAMAFAVFQTVNRRALSGIDVFRGTATVLAMGAVVLLAMATLLHGPGAFLAVPADGYVAFVAAGVLHFSVGWTLLGTSQVRLGAARAGILFGTLPLFGALIAAVALDEALTVLDIAGLVLVVAGVVVALPGSPRTPVPPVPAGPVGPGHRTSRRGRESLVGGAAGLTTALLFAVSPVLVRAGLAHGGEPVVGAAIGHAAAALAYALVIVATAARHRRRGGASRPIARDTRWSLLGAGVAVSTATGLQWTAYDLAPIAVVLSVLQLTPLLVVGLSVVVAREPLGRQAARVWSGAAITVTGAVVLVAG